MPVGPCRVRAPGSPLQAVKSLCRAAWQNARAIPHLPDGAAVRPGFLIGSRQHLNSGMRWSMAIDQKDVVAFTARAVLTGQRRKEIV